MPVNMWFAEQYCINDLLTHLVAQLAITGSAAVVSPGAKISRKKGNSTPCKIVIPENFSLKLCTRDYVGEMTLYANFGFNDEIWHVDA